MLNVWYKVVVIVDVDGFFSKMIKDGIYLGIDVIECWLCDELKVWFVKVFDWEVAWFFKFYDWEVYFFKDG